MIKKGERNMIKKREGNMVKKGERNMIKKREGNMIKDEKEI